MPSRTTLEEVYDTVANDYTITTNTYSDDYITIDMNDLDMDINMTDFSITSTPGIGSLPNDFHVTTHTNTDSGILDSSIFDDITIADPYREFCEYIGLDSNQSVEDFQDMCERYPSLQKALEQFTNTYNIVKDDWHTERNR